MGYLGNTRPYGMGQKQYDAYVAAMAEAGVSKERIVQCIGTAKASAGTHAKDGVDELGHDYSSATDVSIKDLTELQIRKVLLALAKHRFAGWWRHTGSFANNQHIHFVWAGYAMKPALQSQIHDFLAFKNGLMGHATDDWWQHNLQDSVAQAIRVAFLAHNPAVVSQSFDGAIQTTVDCCSEIGLLQSFVNKIKNLGKQIAK